MNYHIIMQAIKPSKDELLGAAAILLIAVCILIVATLGNIGHQISDNTSDNLSDIENEFDHYYDKVCWIEKETELSNQTYKEKVKCGPNQTGTR